MSAGNGSLAALSTEELRAAVRAVLRDVLPAVAAGSAPPAQTVPAGTAAVPGESLTLRTDADLDALVRRVATLCEDPSQRAALRGGRHRFRLASGGATAPGGRPQAASAEHRVESGAVTERAVRKAAADGVRLVVGRRAVLTPLARDRARVLGVEIERER